MDHARGFKAVDSWHTRIHQHYADIIFEHPFESFHPGTSFNEIFAEFLQDHLITEELAGIIVNQQNVHLVVHRLTSFRPKDGDPGYNEALTRSSQAKTQKN